MKRLALFAPVVVSMLMIPSMGHAACPKESKFKMREHKIKAEESLFKAYDYLSTLQHAQEGLKLATGDCMDKDYVFRMHVLAGTSYYYKMDRDAARREFKAAIRVKDADLPDDLAAPALVRFYESVRAEVHKEAAEKKARAEKIKKLEAATGMPPEPEENPQRPIEHNPRPEGYRGRKFLIYCRLRDDILSKAAKVKAYVDTEGDGTYKEFAMKKMGKRRYVVLLGGGDTSVPKLRYYIMAFDAQDKPLAASGNSGMPHTVDMKIPPQAAEDEDEGTEEPKKESKPQPKQESKTEEAKAKPAKEGKKVKQEVDEEPEEEEDVPEMFKKNKEEERAAWNSGVVPMLRFGARFGTGIGWITGHTEVYKTSLNSGFSPAPIQVGFTIAGMISRLWSVGIDIDIGMSPTESDLYDIAADRGVENDGFVTTSLRSDLRILVKARKFSVPEDYSRKIRWRWYWEAGLGGGYMRHMAPGENSFGKSVADTDYSSGAMLGLGAGAMYCITDRCEFTVTAGANYTATYSMDPDNTSLIHFDFFVGTEYMF